MAKYPGVSPSVIRRLPRYYRLLEELIKQGVERISSREFAAMIGLTASQVRQDLNCFGGFGQQGYGYNVAVLRTEIGKILQVDGKKPAILIGTGNLGIAIIRHMEFENRGFRLLGAFDNNPAVIGRQVRDWVVRDMAGLERFCQEHQPIVAILCIPKEVAAEVVERLIQAGIRGFWNFSHYDFSTIYGDVAAIEDVHLGDSLMTLSFNTSELLDSDNATEEEL